MNFTFGRSEPLDINNLPNLPERLPNPYFTKTPKVLKNYLPHYPMCRKLDNILEDNIYKSSKNVEKINSMIFASIFDSLDYFLHQDYCETIDDSIEREKKRKDMKEKRRIVLNMFNEYLDENDKYDFLDDNFKEFYNSSDYKSKHQDYDFIIFVPNIVYYLVNELNIPEGFFHEEVVLSYKRKMYKSSRK